MAESRIDRMNEMLDEAASSGRSLDDVALEILNGHDKTEAPEFPVIAVNPRELGLSMTDKGALRMNLDNVVRVLEADPNIKGHIWYDEFLDAIMTDRQGEPRKWRDDDDIWLQLYAQRHIGLHQVGLGTCHDAAKMAALHDTRNECRNWLNDLQWDGTERLAHMLSDGFGTQQDAYTQAVGRCWMVSIVARVMRPGCKVDTVPVLEGVQGAGKSTALAILGGKWFVECHESVMTKDFFGVLTGHMLVEISEMHSFTRAEVARIKGIISCQVDRYRKAYGRHTEDHPRHTVLVCTTNRDDWQKDETGARRFWPFLCNEINKDWLTVNRDQLFAEAVARFNRGEAWHDVPVAEQQAQVEQRRDVDSWEPQVEEWLTGRSRVLIGQLLDDCFGIEPAKQDMMLQKRASRILRSLGWGNKPLRGDDGKQRKYWVRSDD